MAWYEVLYAEEEDNSGLSAEEVMIQTADYTSEPLQPTN